MLLAHACSAFALPNETYGSRRLVHELRAAGLLVAWVAIDRTIGGFYNPARRHSALNFISPLQFERQAA